MPSSLRNLFILGFSIFFGLVSFCQVMQNRNHLLQLFFFRSAAAVLGESQPQLDCHGQRRL